MLKNKTILIISPEAWGNNFISKHHYAKYLSRNNRVYFLNPAERGNNFHVCSIGENLEVINCPPLIRGLSRMPLSIFKWYSKRYISGILKLTGPLDIVWSFDPYRLQYLDGFKAKVKIYHAVDIHRNDIEFKIFNNADIVFATSDKILEKFAGLSKPRYKINHGLDEVFVHKGDVRVQPLVNNDKGVQAAYLGNLLIRYIDDARFLDLIKSCPDVFFHLIGPYEVSNLGGSDKKIHFVNELKKLPNVHLYGSRNKKEIVSLFNNIDIFFMCYLGEAMPAEMANPHKVLEYLSTGKVIVSTYTDEYKNVPDLLTMTTRNDEFIGLFKKVVADLKHYNADSKQTARIKLAAANTYTQQLERIELLLAENRLLS